MSSTLERLVVKMMMRLTSAPPASYSPAAVVVMMAMTQLMHEDGDA